MKILIWIILAFLAVPITIGYFFFSYNPSVDGLIGRDTVIRYGVNNELSIFKFEAKYYLANGGDDRHTWIGPIEKYKLVYSDMFDNQLLYLYFNGNMAIINQDKICILYFVLEKEEAQANINTFKKYYGLSAKNIIYDFSKLNQTDRSIYGEFNQNNLIN